jgi:putative transposon-encoded protein
MVDFAKLVLELDTSDLEQGEAKLKNLTVAGDKAEKSVKKLGSSAKASAAQLKQATKQVEKFGNGLKISGGHTANLNAQLTAGGE